MAPRPFDFGDMSGRNVADPHNKVKKWNQFRFKTEVSAGHRANRLGRPVPTVGYLIRRNPHMPLRYCQPVLWVIYFRILPKLELKCAV